MEALYVSSNKQRIFPIFQQFQTANCPLEEESCRNMIEQSPFTQYLTNTLYNFCRKEFCRNDQKKKFARFSLKNSCFFTPKLRFVLPKRISRLNQKCIYAFQTLPNSYFKLMSFENTLKKQKVIYLISRTLLNIYRLRF